MISVSMTKMKRGRGLVMNEAVIENGKLKIKKRHNIGVTCAALMCGVFLTGCTLTDKTESVAADSDELIIAAGADTSETDVQN